MVLKHYFRGGLVASIVKDQYFGFDIEKTRAFREWRLLKDMRKLDLPVPNAIAAHVRQGVLYYRADLITQKIENSKTLSDVLVDGVIDDELWKEVGSCIKRFHDKNVYHADLNARNILLTEEGKVYLIDFDNSDFRPGSQLWKVGNLVRLKRSLLKFKKNEKRFNFCEDDWSIFLEGYNQSSD
jgi:3-deoxy-D-manno-octulosonic acid kinase